MKSNQEKLGELELLKELLQRKDDQIQDAKLRINNVNFKTEFVL